MIELNLHTGSNKIFLVDSNTRRTYEDLLEQVHKLYQALQDHIGNETILVQVTDRFHLACTIFALGRLGATYLLLNPKWSVSEVEAVLNHTLSKVAITDNHELLPLTDMGIEVLSPSDLLTTETKDKYHNPISLAGKVLMCTTGTTGEPKIIARTWDAIFSEVDAVLERLNYTEQDCIFCLAQWTHSLGFVLNLLSGIRAGAKLITAPVLSTPSNWVHIMKREEVTILVGVPTFYSFLVQAPDEELNIKMGISAGAALPRDIYEKFRSKFSAPLLQFYGCTEAGAVTMQSVGHETRYPSLGKPLGITRIRILDEDGQPVGKGEIGSIRIKSKGLAHEILWKGAFVPVDSEYETGDQGMFTDEGGLIIIGRNKQRIKINGLGLHPGEVEKVLQQHPDILEAAVTTETDVRRGTSLVSYLRTVNRQPTELEIRKFCQERLATYKIPNKYIFVEDFERDEKGQVKL